MILSAFKEFEPYDGNKGGEIRLSYPAKRTKINYNEEKYKIRNWKSPVILHWIINPGLVINELLLGQTIPKVILIEREKEKSLYQRSLVPCPHCGTLHNGLKWSAQNRTAFKNWLGYYCDNCKEIAVY